MWFVIIDLDQTLLNLDHKTEEHGLAFSPIHQSQHQILFKAMANEPNCSFSFLTNATYQAPVIRPLLKFFFALDMPSSDAIDTAPFFNRYDLKPYYENNLDDDQPYSHQVAIAKSRLINLEIKSRPGFSAAKDNIVLIDDATDNLTIASSYGYQVIDPQSEHYYQQLSHLVAALTVDHFYLLPQKPLPSTGTCGTSPL